MADSIDKGIPLMTPTFFGDNDPNNPKKKTYIERKEAIEFVRNNTPHFDGETTMQCVERSLANVPAADVVSSAVLEQVMWERDMALETLKEHGIGFCEKSDMVEIDKIAELLDELFGNECPCNFNNFDEWLPYVCEYRHTCDCATKEGWKQLILAKMDGKEVTNNG